jgi:polyhydroxyalkanoate synthesis regulator phasin
MMDTLRKTMLLGLGALSLTKEKAVTVADDLVARGEMEEKDRDRMVNNVLAEGQTQKRLLEEKVITIVQKVMTEMGMPTQQDYEDIARRLDGIEKAVHTQVGGKEGTTA